MKENFESEIETWLKTALKHEKPSKIKVKICGNTEKGDGYLGDIVFVTATIQTENATGKTFDLVLKCSKRSEALRKSAPVKETFLNEIYFYHNVLPEFEKLEENRNVVPFDALPKYFGHFTNETTEILVLENLRTKGFELWNKKLPLTRAHIDLVMGQYAKFHAISIAMEDQNRKQFQELTTKIHPIFQLFFENTGFCDVFRAKIDASCEILKGELDDSTLKTWRDFKKQVEYITTRMREEPAGMRVITHGDCWNNNFLYKYTDNLPTNVAIIDWQCIGYVSPILDLSYFLFACISSNDLKHLPEILENYYKSLSTNVKNLGSCLESLWSYEEFLSDWKKYARHGILMTTIIFFVCSTDSDEVIDISDSADKGQDISKSFEYALKDPTVFKDRIRSLIPYVIENNLI